MATFPARLRRLREEQGLTQSELGRRFGLSKQAISTYETGGSSPDKETLSRMADFFNVSVDYLLGRTDVQQPIAGAVHEEEAQYWLRATGGLTEEQKRRLEEFIEFLKFEHERKAIRPKGP
jgi:transcriptional regulator with XRE-family HTH domain